MSLLHGKQMPRQDKAVIANYAKIKPIPMSVTCSTRALPNARKKGKEQKGSKLRFKSKSNIEIFIFDVIVILYFLRIALQCLDIKLLRIAI
jgi:hypothetical protein